MHAKKTHLLNSRIPGKSLADELIFLGEEQPRPEVGGVDVVEAVLRHPAPRLGVPHPEALLFPGLGPRSRQPRLAGRSDGLLRRHRRRGAVRPAAAARHLRRANAGEPGREESTRRRCHRCSTKLYCKALGFWASRSQGDAQVSWGRRPATRRGVVFL
jgi:hypothetical protein